MKTRAILIYGAGRGGAIVAEILQLASGIRVLGFIDDARDLRGKDLWGLPVLGGRHDLPRLKTTVGYDSLVLSMAAAETMNIRRRLFEELVENGESWINAIHPSCSVSPSARLGVDNVVSPLTCFDTGSVVGDNNRIGSHCSIGHHSQVGNHNLIGSGCMIGALAFVGNSCILGDGVILEPQVKIADGTHIPSGAVVSAKVD